MEESELKAAHKVSIYHRDQIIVSEVCGCFYCAAIFKPSEIDEWTDYEEPEIGAERIGRTALCPKCSIDSVIGSASGYEIDVNFLTSMKKYWF